MREYDFQTELQALRTRIAAEHNLEIGYLRINYESMRPLVILMEQQLSHIKNKEDRKDVRMAILSLWIGEHVNSTYDLTVYQCSTILNFLEYTPQGLGERARRFFEDSESATKVSNHLPAQDTNRLEKPISNTLPDLS